MLSFLALFLGGEEPQPARSSGTRNETSPDPGGNRGVCLNRCDAGNHAGPGGELTGRLIISDGDQRGSANGFSARLRPSRRCHRKGGGGRAPTHPGAGGAARPGCSQRASLTQAMPGGMPALKPPSCHHTWTMGRAKPCVPPSPLHPKTIPGGVGCKRWDAGAGDHGSILRPHSGTGSNAHGQRWGLGRDGVCTGCPGPTLCPPTPPAKQRSPAAARDAPGLAGWLQGGSQAE